MIQNSQNKIPAYLPVVFAVLLAVGIYIGTKLNSTKSSNVVYSIGNDKGQKLNQVLNYISNDYVDTVNNNQLVDKAINSMLEDLDPHSQYITREEFDDMNDPLEGNFDGIGIAFRIEKDTIMVINTIPGGPSEKVGLLAGDRIVKVNDSTIVGKKLNNQGAFKLLKGPRGTEVDVSILRKGVPQLIDFNIVRDVIPTYSLDIAYMVNDSIGYIKLNKFSATTYREADKALRRLKSEGMTKLILDLRGNSGGYLQAAVQLADEFLKDKELIVYTKGKNRQKREARATSKGRFQSQEMVVLIDEGSASASEIIAGAIQDNDRGTIIGRRSFGKGLVQEQIALPDGSAIRLTVARYYTPTGRSIQKPYDKGKEEYYKEAYERYFKGETIHEDSIHFNDSLKFTTPKGKTVYGGGGIMPDIYIPLVGDSTLKYFNILANKGLIFRFAFEYTDTHRAELNKYKDADDFIAHFMVSDKIFNDLIDFAKKKGVKGNKQEIQKSKKKIKVLLKAFIGRNVFDEKAFYPLYNQIDTTFKKAVQYLEDDHKQ
ncbi:MAG: S41 family peptidase [Bacteroidales bacterium]